MKTLVIIAHPDIENSRGNKALRDAIAQEPDVTVRELYKLYPDFNIDAARELMREYFAKFGDRLPKGITQQVDQLEQRLK